MVFNHVWAWGMQSSCEEFCFVRIKIRNWDLLLSSFPKCVWISHPLCPAFFSYSLICIMKYCPLDPRSLYQDFENSASKSPHHSMQVSPGCFQGKENKHTFTPQSLWKKTNQIGKEYMRCPIRLFWLPISDKTNKRKDRPCFWIQGNVAFLHSFIAHWHICEMSSPPTVYNIWIIFSSDFNHFVWICTFPSWSSNFFALNIIYFNVDCSKTQLIF